MTTDRSSAEKPLSELLNKTQLAGALGWSVQTLDRALATDPHFPVVRRGWKGVPWQFDVDQVRVHVARASAEREREAVAARAARISDDPGERRLHAMAARLEVKAGALAVRYVRRDALAVDLDRMHAELQAFAGELRDGLVQRFGLAPTATVRVDRVFDAIAAFKAATDILVGATPAPRVEDLEGDAR